MSLTIQALILESNGETFMRGNNVLLAGNNVGLLGQIPTPEGGGTNEGDFWVTPVNNEDVVTSMGFTPYNLLTSLPAKPKPYSLPATKIRWQGVNNIGKPDYYFVLGTSAQWAAGSLPDQTSLVYWPTSQSPDPVTNSSTGVITANVFKIVLGLPSLNGSPQRAFFPKGWVDGTALAAASSTGYTNTTLLLNFLNASWGSFGSPSKAIVWTLSPNSTSVIGTFTDTDSDEYSVVESVKFDAFIWAIS